MRCRKIKRKWKRHKKALLIIGALLLSAAVCLGVFMLRADRVSIEGEAEVCFRYGENDVRQRLEGAGRDELAAIVDGKRLYRGDPSCGFDEDVSVRFGTQTFCIARDTCPILYCKEEDRYLKLSDAEKSRLYELLAPYGFFFPCVSQKEKAPRVGLTGTGRSFIILAAQSGRA